jgi:high-affinity Fe2+/Pb2+ permease
LSERLTHERGERTWRLFRISWYVNIALVVISLYLALFFFSRMWHGYASNIAAGSSIMMGFVVIACLLLMGAGICRYQARLEGQNLEIKLAVQKALEELNDLKARLEKEASPHESASNDPPDRQ